MLFTADRRKKLTPRQFDQEVEHMATEIQKLAGLAVARNVMNVLGALGKLVEEQEEEVRGTIRRLGTL